jgi:lipopolysaccharide transport system ATP-binding protein
MSEPVIVAENLSKKYLIGENIHGRGARTFRDIFDYKMRGIFSRRERQRKKEETTIWALKDVSFEVGEGEVVGIIGRNGAGKSTLLKILSRITEPTMGRVILRGRVASLLEVGTGFNLELTGRENIYLNGSILGMRKAEIDKRFDEIVQFAEIEKFLDTPVKRYSSGMYVRLAFAVAAHLEPEILLVDEVLAVGDAQFQKKCLGKMRDVGREGRTVLFVSHNLSAVEQLCGRGLLIDGGVLRYSGNDTKDVIKKYVASNVAGAKSNIWINKGNEFQNSWFFPKMFCICDKDGKDVGFTIRNDEEIFLEVGGVITELDDRLAIAYFIYSSDNTLLYQSATHDVNAEKRIKFELGENVVRTRISKRFLNEDEYRIELVIFLHCYKYIAQQTVNAPSIYFQIEGGLSDSLQWITKRQGLLAPEMEWELVDHVASDK